MAKKGNSIRIRLISESGYTYYTNKNPRTMTEKMEVRKYDPWTGKHEVFKEKKMPPHAKN